MTVSDPLSYNHASMTTKLKNQHNKNNEELEDEIADLESRLHHAKIRLASSDPVASRSDGKVSLSHAPNGMRSWCFYSRVVA